MRGNAMTILRRRVMAVVCLLVCAAGGRQVNAADFTATKYCRTSVAPVRVYVSRVIPRPVNKVWAGVRDFQKAYFVKPAYASPANKRPGDQLGSRRFVNYPGGKRVLEELTGLDDVNYIQSYRLFPNSGTNGNLSPKEEVVPFPLCNLRGGFRLYPVTLTNETLIIWELSFLTTVKKQQTAQTGVTGLITGILKQI